MRWGPNDGARTEPLSTPRPDGVQTVRVTRPYPADIVGVLSKVGADPDDVLGHGGEAWVFALGTDRVVRVLHLGGRVEEIHRRQELVNELAKSRPSYLLPEVLEVGQAGSRVYVIERRLPGRSLRDVLGSLDGPTRPRLIETYLETVASLGDLHLEPRGGFGDLIAKDAIIRPTWRAYMTDRAATNLAGSLPEFRSIDAQALADALPEPDAASFVHLDAYVGNVLTDGLRITAVIDIGVSSVAGDRRLDPLAAVVDLLSPQITPMATTADVDVAMSWLRNAGLADCLEPAGRWFAAFWSFAVGDANVMSWCRMMLLEAPRD